MKWHQVKEYFIFTRKERTGVVVLIFLIVIVYFIPEFFPGQKSYYLDDRSDTLFHIIETRSNKLNEPKEKNTGSDTYREIGAVSTTRLFTFDPNTLNEDGWKLLGVPEKTIRTILNFRAKGGRFRSALDIKKIYGFQKKQAEILIPYVRIDPGKTKSRDEYQNAKLTFPSSSITKKAIQPVEINAADSIQLIALPGIGTKLASRIMAYRERLGGFYSIHQISETYGLSDSTFQLIKPYLMCDVTRLKKINVNNANNSILKDHPYIRWNLSNAIIKYRQQHGKFYSVDDLMKIEIITESTYKKIAPYIVTE